MPIKQPIIFFLFYICGIMTSCKEKRQGVTKTNDPVQDPVPVKYIKPPASFNDSILINTSSAVFFVPDTGQLASIKKIIPGPAFESSQHDCFYQMQNARSVIKKYWPAIQIIETSKARYLLFIKKDKTTTCIDLNSKGDMCGIFLFDQKKEPELVDMMNIDTALRFYFNTQ